MRKRIICYVLIFLAIVSVSFAPQKSQQVKLVFAPHSARLTNTYKVQLKQLYKLHSWDTSLCLVVEIYRAGCEASNQRWKLKIKRMKSTLEYLKSLDSGLMIIISEHQRYDNSVVVYWSDRQSGLLCL